MANAELFVGDEQQPKRFGETDPVRCDAVRVKHPAGAFTVNAANSEGDTRLRYPLVPNFSYGKIDQEFFDNCPFHIGLLSTQYTDPPACAQGEWRVVCQPRG